MLNWCVFNFYTFFVEHEILSLFILLSLIITIIVGFILMFMGKVFIGAIMLFSGLAVLLVIIIIFIIIPLVFLALKSNKN